MAIKTDYNYKGLEIKDSIIKIDRLWGSKKEGWSALVGVYNVVTKSFPAVEEVSENRLVSSAVVDEDGNVIQDAVYIKNITVHAKDAYTEEINNRVDEFNHNAKYNDDERGYESIYISLQEKFGGEEC